MEDFILYHLIVLYIIILKKIWFSFIILYLKNMFYLSSCFSCSSLFNFYNTLLINFSMRIFADFHRKRWIPPAERSACQHERHRRNKEEIRLRRRLPPPHILLLSNFFWIPLQQARTSERSAVERSQFRKPSGQTLVHQKFVLFILMFYVRNRTD